jgi:predicted nucleic acid-binding protein
MITLVDAGPLIALIDKGQGEAHQQCLALQQRLPAPLLTSWPCFTEAMYMLGRIKGWAGQKLLWQFYRDNGGVEFYDLSEAEISRMHELMEKYHNVPMDLADASLVVIAETTGLRQLFTLDDDFYIYRINDRDSFDVIPLN